MSNMSMEFTAQDLEALANLKQKQEHLRTGVISLHEGYDTGFFVWGEGGTGKSYIIGNTLRELRAQYILHNSRMTARGLVDSLEKAPQIIHWIEDAETLLDDKKTFGVLRSALWSQDKRRPPRREVTWTAFKTTIRFEFTGSILVISNANFVESIPEVRAIKTRIRVLHLDVSAAEVFALMKQICQAGYILESDFGQDVMTPEECWMVACFIVSELSTLKRQLDLRLITQGFKDYLLYRNRKTDLPWQETLKSRMQEKPTVKYQTRQAIASSEAVIALAIDAKAIPYAEKLKEWAAATGGKGKSAYDRAKKR